ncbi:MAG: response regulator [bacterium]
MITGLKILVVDDESYIRDLLCNVLREQGNDVDSAVDGEDALKQVALHQPDVILTDIKMPRMDGFSLLRQVKQQYPTISVVVMTAFSQDYTIREALLTGAEEYLAKPFRSEEVLMVVERAYWRGKSRRERAAELKVF